MRTSITIFALLFALSVSAQETQSNEEFRAATQLPEASITPAPSQTTPLTVTKPAATYGGAAVQAVRAPNPLQMINPLAPASYGSGEENVSRDPVSGRTMGINLVSISW